MIDFDEVFRKSYERALGHRTSQKNEFFTRFYERFIAASPVVEEKFAAIDMQMQKAMLKQSIYHLLNLFSTKKITDTLVEVAHRHDPEHADIPPELYLLWLECLIDTVREFDPAFDEEVELAWRMVCSQGIAFMIHVHRQVDAGTKAGPQSAPRAGRALS